MVERDPGSADAGRGGGRASSEPGEKPDEEDHADEGETNQHQHEPKEPVHGLLGMLLQALRLSLQLLEVQVRLLHGLCECLEGRGWEGTGSVT